MKYGEKLKILKSNMKLDELIRLFPETWSLINIEMKELVKKSSAESFNQYMIELKKRNEDYTNKIKNQPSLFDSLFPELLKIKMTFLALEKIYLIASTKTTSKTIKFSYLNGMILQKLLFYYDFERKPVSLFWFNFFWTFISQKNFLMPLVNKKGIYCFYTKKFVDELSKIIRNKTCIELACGDGALTSFLNKNGNDIKATDNKSWNKYINYPEFVENLSAEKALEKYKPQIVICSWSPPMNNFEKIIFDTQSVEKYIYIGSRYKFASGNWETYEKQKDFEYQIDEKLSRLILPVEMGNIVVIFKRKY